MSQPSCDACSNLREYNAQFIMNGVSDSVAESLQNNTGFNSCLDELHTDCEDLNDANDCLLGHMDDDVDNFEVCDWKDFMHNLLPNLYEVIKAIIAAVCGLWTKLEKLEELVCALVDIVMGNGDGIIAERVDQGVGEQLTMWLVANKHSLLNVCGEAQKDILNVYMYCGIPNVLDPDTGWSGAGYISDGPYANTLPANISAGTVLWRWKTEDVKALIGDYWTEVYGSAGYLQASLGCATGEILWTNVSYSADKQYIEVKAYYDVNTGGSGGTINNGTSDGKVYYTNYKDFWTGSKWVF